MAHPLRRAGLTHYQDGMTIREVSRLLRVSSGTVQLWVSSAGVARPPGPRARRNQLQQQAIELREQGLTLREVAVRLGVSHTTIYTWTRTK